MVFDMSAVIHMIKPQCAKLFWDYTQMHCYLFLMDRYQTTPQGSMQSVLLTKKEVFSLRPMPKGVKLLSVEQQEFLQRSQY